LRKIRVGTRGSRLALEQTRIVVSMLSEKIPRLKTQVIPVRTLGDRLPENQRGETDGKGAFTGDIEELLAEGKLDIAVHSMKDLSVKLDERLEIVATPPRGDPRDALVSSIAQTLADLPRGGSVGTSSIRRKAQLLVLRGDLRIIDLHGNVETRVEKMGKLGLGGIVLAAAGLDRLSLSEKIAQRFPTEEIVPAAGQGTIAIEARRGDGEMKKVCSRINDERTMAASECERAFARAVGGDCNVPAGAYASFVGRHLKLTGMIASQDGRSILKKSMTSTRPTELGRELGETLLRMGGAEIIGALAT